MAADRCWKAGVQMAESRTETPNSLRPEFKKTLLDQQGATVVLWAFFIVAIPLYLWIAWLILSGSTLPAKFSFSEAARILLWLLVLVDLGYLVWWKKRHLSREGIFGESKKVKLLRVLEGHQNSLEERAARVVSTYVIRKIVAFAIVEAIAVYGLVLALVGRYLWDQYLFSLISSLLLIIEFPSRKRLEEIVASVEARKPNPHN